MASFVRDHLGPTLAAEQPGVQILGFDHNKVPARCQHGTHRGVSQVSARSQQGYVCLMPALCPPAHPKDHVATWAAALYADPEAKKYFAGVGVHWYATHRSRPHHTHT